MPEHEISAQHPQPGAGPQPGPQPSSAAAGQALPYAEVTEPDYAVKAARFEANPTRGGTILQGPCPRCTDMMAFPVVVKVYRVMRRQPASAGHTARDPVVPMICTCEMPHPGAPDRQPGCGAYWNLRVGSSAS